ncbi:hypothetical protein [Taibaiella chishuiensis]|uniref:Uncharacterized protein n=1 Tax=Taibaiella chishuiensis TaxID=1434707 RepID=A0A2P8CX36_9BACT|nr:hypothetical protein [Taibaiella chishuiensis]PSK89538.1 hypothetical protein B0I18_11194 [Taibaiella chishuiensis]
MADAPKITTELFRFVTVRNPEPRKLTATAAGSASPPSTAATASSFLAYPAEGTAEYQMMRSGYLAKLTARRNAGGENKDIFSGLVDEASQFRNTGSFIDTEDNWKRKFPSVQQFIDGVAALGDKEKTIDKIMGIATRTLGDARSLPSWENVPLASVAWDNLFTYNIIGSDTPTMQYVMSILRADYLLQQLNINRENAQVDNLLKASVMLPSSVFPLPKLERENTQEEQAYDDTLMTDEQVAKVNASLSQIARIQGAIDNLNAAFGQQVEEVRVTTTGPKIPQFDDQGNPVQQENTVSVKTGVIDPQFKGRLAAATNDILQERKYTQNVQVPFVVQQLQDELAAHNKTVQQNLKLNQDVILVGNALFQKTINFTDKQTPIRDTPIKDPVTFDPGTVFNDNKGCRVKPLGIADYRRVEQTLICYKPGEVAHIENILKGEGKERSTRRLSQTEDTTILTTESEKTDERDTITTDRYQIEKEVGKVVQKDQSLAIGVSVQGSYGVTSVQATANFTTSNSSTQSDSQATTYAKDVTSRALQRVIQKTSEQQIHRVLEEFEEINKHTLNNVGGADHIVGLYRWVDKIYEAKVVNYGRRLMFEFMVPDPGAFHRYAMSTPIASQVSIAKPLDPIADIQAIQQKFPGIAPLKSADNIDRGNYLFWAGLYNANVSAPPADYQVVAIGKSQTRVANDGTTSDAFSYTDLIVPDGYKAMTAYISMVRGGSKNPSNVAWSTVNVGYNGYFVGNNGSLNASFALNNETGMIPVSVMGRMDAFGLNVEVQCSCLPETMQNWKVKTFKAVMDAYEALLAQYNNAIAEVKSGNGVEIRGTNPAINRQIEQNELKKHSVRLLSSCTFVPSEAMQDRYGGGEYPDFDCCTAIRDGKYVQFVENCFDWQLMTYSFYPYFWSRKAQWKKIYQLDDADPVFLQFLQAGYARVVVPVREGFEQAALRFAADGTVWGGGDAPGINDPYYVSLVDEMKKPIGIVEGDPWQVRVPTTLTILQKDASGIDESGLPCNPNGI